MRSAYKFFGKVDGRDGLADLMHEIITLKCTLNGAGRGCRIKS
jgi:hypothetical protein